MLDMQNKSENTTHNDSVDNKHQHNTHDKKVVDTTHVGRIVYPKRYVSHRDVIVIYRYIPSLNCPMLFHIAHRGGICFLFFVRSCFLCGRFSIFCRFLMMMMMMMYFIIEKTRQDIKAEETPK